MVTNNYTKERGGHEGRCPVDAKGVLIPLFKDFF